MKRIGSDRDVVDDVLLGWLLVWGVVMTIAIASVLAGKPATDLPDTMQIVLGIAMGGLAAVLIAAGTWAELVHLPISGLNSQETHSEQPQRIAPRVGVLIVIVIDLLVLIYAAENGRMLVAQLVVIAAIGASGPLLVWQYTRKRIYRQTAATRGRQSIRQILGMVLTIAIIGGALKLADRAFGLSTPTTLFMLSVAILWTLMTLIMLGRWWWLFFLTLPLFAAQWLAIASMIDSRTAEGEAEFTRLGGLLTGFYFFGFLFLSLMRSSGHRWLGNSPDEIERAQTDSRNSGVMPNPR